MEYFDEDHSKLLLSKEWLVKVDGESSTAYMMKFSASFSDQSCILTVTDTKSVWAEVMNTQRLIRRWHALNPSTSPIDLPPPEAKREQWADSIVQCLADSHTPGGMDELSMELESSPYADLCIAFGGDGFKWRWDACIVPPKLAAEVLSKHLILPLVSTAHLAFTTSDPLGEMSESELEKAIDKVGRTARRSVDTHLRTTITRPRLSTTLRRVTALFDFSANLPRIHAEAERPDIILPTAPQELESGKGKGRAPSRDSALEKTPSRLSSPGPAPDIEPMAVDEPDFVVDVDINGKDKVQTESQPSALAGADSDTAPESDTEPANPSKTPALPTSTTLPASDSDSPPVKTKPTAPRKVIAPALNESSSGSDAKPKSKPVKTPARHAGDSSSPDSSPPPAKKSKSMPARKPAVADDSSSDSDGERRPAGVRRGTRQPIKRGGRRF